MSTRIDINTTGTQLSTATILKTGQTISYRTGDDGDIEAGRDINFFTLNENNPFGTDKRFTDELGTLVYANNIVIDWSTYNGTTVLGYRRTLSPTAVNWNDAVDGALAVSIGSYTSGWRLTNIREIMNLCYFEGLSYLNYIDYAPFNITSALWSSTALSTYGGLYSWQLLQTSIGYSPNNTLTYYIPCRTFTVTGTTLT